MWIDCFRIDGEVTFNSFLRLSLNYNSGLTGKCSSFSFCLWLTHSLLLYMWRTHFIVRVFLLLSRLVLNDQMTESRYHVRGSANCWPDVVQGFSSIFPSSFAYVIAFIYIYIFFFQASPYRSSLEMYMSGSFMLVRSRASVRTRSVYPRVWNKIQKNEERKTKEEEEEKKTRRQKNMKSDLLRCIVIWMTWVILFSLNN